MLKEKMAAWNVSRFSKPSYCLWFLLVLYSHIAAKGNLKKPISINIPDTKTSSVCVSSSPLLSAKAVKRMCSWMDTTCKSICANKKGFVLFDVLSPNASCEKKSEPIWWLFLNVWTFFGVWSKFFWAGAINDGGELLTAAKYNTGKKLNDQFFFSHLVF